MRSQSFLSQLSNLSNISQASCGASKQEYSGSQFLVQSLPFASNKNVPNNEVKLEYVYREGSEIDFTHPFPYSKEYAKYFSPYWTNSQCENIEGTSDNENEPDLVKKQPDEVKQEPKSSQNEFSEVVEEKQSSAQKPLRKNIKCNETKNIPKNYGKAIIIFIQKNREILSKVLQDHKIDYDQLLQKLNSMKRNFNTILDLKNLWQSHLESKAIRIISNYFLRKHSLHYIYNSRIKTRLCHAKYKTRLQEAITNPKEFNFIKHY